MRTETPFHVSRFTFHVKDYSSQAPNKLPHPTKEALNGPPKTGLISHVRKEIVKIGFSRLFSITLCVVLTTLAGTAQVTQESALIEQIKQTMARVQASKTVDAKTEAAEHLASLTRKIDRKEVTEALVIDLTSLLDAPNDSVRFWLVTALGNLGPSAKAAAPKLEKLLPEVDCLNGAITSAGAIRHALEQMGVKPPAPPKCERIAG